MTNIYILRVIMTTFCSFCSLFIDGAKITNGVAMYTYANTHTHTHKHA